MWCCLISLSVSIKASAGSVNNPYDLWESQEEETEEKVAHNSTPKLPKYSKNNPLITIGKQKRDDDDDTKDDYEALPKKKTHNVEKMLPLPNSLCEMEIFPSPYEYVILSKHVYLDVEVGEKVSGKYGNNEQYQLDDWEVYANLSEDAKGIFHTIFKSLDFPSGYRGILYYNKRKKQMVLAHRGTDPKNLSAVETDIKSIAQNDIGAGQERFIIGLVRKALEKAKEASVKSLSFTGHSLGGWLAQISLFVFFDQKRIFEHDFYENLYIKAVTFDTPGARDMLEKMSSRNGLLHIDHLDITNYLSSPNLVNCCNWHVGSLYRVIFKQLSKLPGKYTLESHAMDNFVAAFDHKRGDAKQCLLMRSWPKLDVKNIKDCITTKPFEMIDNIFLLLQKCAKGECLGEEYKNFLQLAQKTDTTHIAAQDLEEKCLFDVNYKYHYKSEHPNYQKLHRRHIPKQLYRPLVNLLPTSLPCFYGLKRTENDELFRLSHYQDSRLFLDAVMQKGTKWLETLVKPPTAHQLAFGPLPNDTIEKENLPEFPHQRNYIIKREETLQALHDNFQKQPKQVLIGYGGMGKSTLALLYAKEYFDKKKYYNTVWWFNAENDVALEDSISAVIKSMCIQFNDNANARQKMKKIQQQLTKSSNWLLIFDNVTQPTTVVPYISNDLKKVHILITSRYAAEQSWKDNNIYIEKIATLRQAEAVSLLERFCKPKDKNEEKALQQLLSSGLIELIPLTLSQIGHYIKKQNRHTPYKDYLTSYRKEKENNRLKNLEKNHLDSKKDIVANDYDIFKNISIVNTFNITLNQIKLEVEESKEELEETERILRVMSFLNPDGLDWRFFEYLRPSRRGKWFKSYVKDSAKIIDTEKARKSANCLREYGILIDEGNKSRTHRTIQAIIRYQISHYTTNPNDKNIKDLTPYIKDQVLQLLETIQKEAPAVAAEVRFEMAAHCRNLMGHIAHNEKKRLRLLRLMSQVNSQAYLNAHLYLPPQASNNKALHQQVLQFVHGKETLLLLTGDAGAGKSTYGYYLVKALWQIYYQSYIWAYLPLFISLPAYCAEGLPKNLIERALLRKGLPKEAIEMMRNDAYTTKQPWMFILDGYDEIHAEYNVFEKVILQNWGPKNKYIITCRTEYLEVLKQQGKTKEALFSGKDTQVTELSIAPFSTKQVLQYVVTFADSDYNLYKEKDWDSNRYQKELEKLPKLQEWMTTPFILVIGLQALPRLYQKNNKQNALKAISKPDICEAFIEEWITRETNKPQCKISSEELETFCEKLGYQLFISKKQIMEKHDDKMKTFFQSAAQLQSAPLRHVFTSPGSYEFIHSDFRNFFALSYMLKNWRIIEKNKTLQELLHENDINLFLLDYLRKMLRSKANDSVQILIFSGYKNFSNENLTQLDLKGIDFSDVQLPKNLTYTDLKGAKLPQNLFNVDLRGAQLPRNLANINLSRAQLPEDISHTTLVGADLSYTNLNHIKLPKNLSYVKLCGAQLPEDLSDTTLVGADLSHTNLTHIKLPRELFQTKLIGANLSSADLRNILLPGDLSKVNLHRAQLPEDISRITLVGTDLSETDLRNIVLPKDLARTKLSGANLSNTDLRKIWLPKDLFKVKLCRAQLPEDISHTTLIRTDLSATDLRAIKLPKDLSDTTLIEADLSNTDLRDIVLPKDLFHTKLTGANLSNTDLRNIVLPKNLSYVKLCGAQLPKDLSKTTLVGADLSYTNLTYIKLPRELSRTKLIGANLSDTDLRNIVLPIDLSRTTLIGANLSNTNLEDIKLPKDLSKVILHGAQLPQDLSDKKLIGANLSNTDLRNILLPKDLSHVNMQGAQLPQDLSKTNLTNTTLTGQNFTSINLAWTQLYGAILTDTTCDYRQCFEDHVKINELSGGEWYCQNLPRDLKSIAEVYPKLTQDSYKAELLQIASEFAYLPCYESAEFYIKAEYCSCKLLMLKKKLKNYLGEQLVCSMAASLEYEATVFCWETRYSQYQIKREEKKTPHDDFDQYLKTFGEGLGEYSYRWKNEIGYDWYKNNIEKNIKGLKKAYPKMTSKNFGKELAEKLKEEAIDIAFNLSQQYKKQHWDLLFSYLFYQNKLIKLKSLAGVKVKNDIYYKCEGIDNVYRLANVGNDIGSMISMLFNWCKKS